MARNLLLPLALTCALTLLLAATALAAPGDFDDSFGGDGIATVDWGGVDSVQDVLVQPDGKIVASGWGSTVPIDLIIGRLNPDGTPDTGFFEGGFIDFPLGGTDRGFAVARQADGKLVAAGSTATGILSEAVVVRTNSDGTPDDGFADGSIAPITGSTAFDVAVQADGRIVAAGVESENWVVTRLTPGGEPDASFDGDGEVVVDFGGFDSAREIALQSNGKVIVAGLTQGADLIPRAAVARFNADGSPDASFDGDGRRVLDRASGHLADAVLVQPDGKLVVIGWAEDSAATVTRLNAGGSLDESFDGDGMATIAVGSAFAATSAVLQANGKIVVAGASITGASSLAAVARLQPGGALDTTFSSDGRQSLSGVSSFANGIALQPNGRLVLAGTTNGDALFARLEGDPPGIGGAPRGGPGEPGGGGRGGATTQVPRCAGKRATIVGSTRSDRLKGTRRADVIVALGGNDRIAAGRGNDLICAGDGNDSIDGGLGNDRLFGQNGTDKLGGGSGKDQLSGGSGRDRLSGGGGKDSCAGNAGRDTASCERGRA